MTKQTTTPDPESGNWAFVRHADGTVSPAEPLGWQGPANQVDWEVLRGVAHWVGKGYNRHRYVGTVVASTRLGFMFKARRQVGWRTPVTFLWDAK